MIHRFRHTWRDTVAFDSLNINSEDLLNDYHDYSHEIINKPWGYEYQILSNNEVSIWIMNINEGQSTSFHCHPNKVTALVVLESNGLICKSISHQRDLYKGDIVLIDKGVFHQTTSFMLSATVMEIETPNNKNDLVRYKDIYGRA